MLLFGEQALTNRDLRFKTNTRQWVGALEECKKFFKKQP